MHLEYYTSFSYYTSGSFATKPYVRVFAPDGMTDPRVCPCCEDKLRDGSEIREARSARA
jgi:hypothetical protein